MLQEKNFFTNATRLKIDYIDNNFYTLDKKNENLKNFILKYVWLINNNYNNKPQGYLNI